MKKPTETAFRPLPPLPATPADPAPLALRWSAHVVLPSAWPGRVELPSGAAFRIGAAGAAR